MAPRTKQETIDLGMALPAFITGSIDLARYPGVEVGMLGAGPAADAQRTLNATKMAEAFDKKRFVELSPDRFEYAATDVQEGINVGLQVPFDCPGVIGAGPAPERGTRLVQHARNHPALTISDVGDDDRRQAYARVYRGFAVGYGTSQADQPFASTLMLGRTWACRFEDIVEHSYLAGNGRMFPGMVGLHFFTVSKNFSFSNTLTNIRIMSAQRNLLRTTSLGTGNCWQNVYLGDGGFKQRVRLTGAAVHLSTSSMMHFGGAFAQLNIEWVEANRLVFCEGMRSGAFNSLRIEGCRLVGFNPDFFHVTNSKMSIQSLAMMDNLIAADGGKGATVFHANYDSSIDVVDAEIHWSGAGHHPDAVMGQPIRLVRVDEGGNGDTAVSVRHLNLTGPGYRPELFGIDGSLPREDFGSISSIGNYDYRQPRSGVTGAVIPVMDADCDVYGAFEHSTVRFLGPLSAERRMRISSYVIPGSKERRHLRSRGDSVKVRRDGSALGDHPVRVEDMDGNELCRLNEAGSHAVLVADGEGGIHLEGRA